MNNFPGAILNYIKFIEENIFATLFPWGKKSNRRGLFNPSFYFSVWNILKKKKKKLQIFIQGYNTSREQEGWYIMLFKCNCVYKNVNSVSYYAIIQCNSNGLLWESLK